MRRALAHASLIAWLALAANAAAQLPGTPSPAGHAESHIFSALTSRADPKVLADNVALGPVLREQLGAEDNSRKIYEALIDSLAGKPLRSRILSPGEAASQGSLPGIDVSEPVVVAETDDVRLVLQYDTARKSVAFVEQLARTPQAETPKPAPLIAVPLPTTPAPPLPPKPAPAKPRPDRPRGECVIKPVMTEDDLWNCSAPGQASTPLIATPPPAASPAALPPQAPERATAECLIKPVMSEEDLRACGARR